MAKRENEPEKKPARRGRSKPPRRVPARPGMERAPHPEHDVLIFPRRDQLDTTTQFIRVPAAEAQAGEVADPQAAGSQPKVPPRKRPPYGSPSEAWDLLDYGARRAVSAARPELAAINPPAEQAAAQASETAGPAFAVLPVKPEPSAASFATCYLVNVENLAGRNFWTVEEWSDTHPEIDYSTPSHPDEFEALIAGPWGKVYRIKFKRTESWPDGPIQIELNGEVVVEIEDVNLQTEPQIWTQLRNGTVAGRAWFKRDSKSIPLVNITALGSELPFKEASAGASGDDQ